MFHPVAVGTVEEGTNRLKLSMSKGHTGDSASRWAVTAVNAVKASKQNHADADLADVEGRPPPSHAKGVQRPEQSGATGPPG